MFFVFLGMVVSLRQTATKINKKSKNHHSSQQKPKQQRPRPIAQGVLGDQTVRGDAGRRLLIGQGPVGNGVQCGVDVGMVAANIGNIGLVPCRFLVVVWFGSVLFAFWLGCCDLFVFGLGGGFVCFVWFYFVCFFVGWLFWFVLASVLFGRVVVLLFVSFGLFLFLVGWLFVLFLASCLFCLFVSFVCFFVGVSCGGKPKTWEHMGWGA